MRLRWISVVALHILVAACTDDTLPSHHTNSGDVAEVGDASIDVRWDFSRVEDAQNDGSNDDGAELESSRQALVCDGVDDRLTIPIGDLLAHPESLTVDLWFRPDSYLPVGSRRTYVLSASAGDELHDELSVGFRDSYGREHRSIDFKARVAEDGSCDGARGSGWLDELEIGQWHHFAATLERRPSDGRVVQRIFIDGISKAGNGSAWPADEAICIEPTVLTICAGIVFDGIFSAPFVGAIDDVRVSDVVRYDGDFVPEPPEPDANTVLLLRFDEWPLVDEGAYRLAIEAEGRPVLAAERL